MYTIKKLLGDKEKVWIYLDNDEICKKFFEMAKAEGYTFRKLPYDEWKIGKIIAVHSDGSMGHISVFCWQMSFGSDITGVPERYDFTKYIQGDNDYICYESHFHEIK